MKKLLFLAMAIVASAMSMNAQTEDKRVLLTIDGEPSTVEEFLYIYGKNSPEVKYDQKSINEYLDLFVTFKLKVIEAERQGIDTTADFKKELESYRKQAAPKYMMDNDAQEAMIQTCYKRMQTDRKVRHIAMQCPANASKAEEDSVLARLNVARERILHGIPTTIGTGKKMQVVPGKPEAFEDVAVEMSTDPNVKNTKGLVGWITPFRYVYPFEQAAYNTEVGGISEIFRTPYGFHFLKVEEEAPHIEVHAQHIMKMAPQNNDSISKVAKEAIDSLYMIAVALDVDFGALASQSSDDRGSAKRGGDLGWFGRGQMVKEFEDAAFGMSQEGAICEPIKSKYGWHIIKYLGRRGTGELDAQMREDLIKKIKQDERQKDVDAAFVEKLKKEYHFIPNAESLQKFMALGQKYGDIHDSIFKYEAAKINGTIFSIDGEDIPCAKFAEYMATNTWSQKTSIEDVINEKFDLFSERMVREKENANLVNKYPEFRNLITEYHDGILLFDVSLKEVWDKASLDTVGITNFFNAHKKEYKWKEPHYKGWVVSCKDASTMKAAQMILKNADPDSVQSYFEHRINIDSIPALKAQYGLWVMGQEPAVDKFGFKQKKAEFKANPEYSHVFVSGKKLKSPEIYLDERGKVTSAYQDYLEQEWVKTLRQKYEIKIDEEVLKSLYK